MTNRSYNTGLILTALLVLSIPLGRLLGDFKVSPSDYHKSFIAADIRTRPLSEISESSVFKVKEEFSQLILKTDSVHQQVQKGLSNTELEDQNLAQDIKLVFKSISNKDSALLYFMSSMIELSDSFYISDKSHPDFQKVYIIPQKKVVHFDFKTDTAYCLQLLLKDRENHPLPEILRINSIEEYLSQMDE